MVLKVRFWCIQSSRLRVFFSFPHDLENRSRPQKEVWIGESRLGQSLCKVSKILLNPFPALITSHNVHGKVFAICHKEVTGRPVKVGLFMRCSGEANFEKINVSSRLDLSVRLVCEGFASAAQIPQQEKGFKISVWHIQSSPILAVRWP